MRKKRGNDSFDIKAWTQRQRAKQQENMDQMVDALCVLIKSQIGFKVKMDSEQRQLSAELYGTLSNFICIQIVCQILYLLW